MVKGPVSSVRTWEERQGVSPPRQISPTASGLKRSRPVSAAKPGPDLSRLLGQVDREVIIESRSDSRQQKQQQQPPPPPPPPPPEKERRVDSINVYTTPTLAKLAQSHQAPKAPAAKKTTKPTSNGHGNSTGSSTGSSSGSSSGAASPKRDGVETESLDSFTLEHPAPAAPKPPSTYFDGTPRNREVLVSISAYGDNKPPPTRFHFLSERSQADESDCRFDRASVRLQHELVQTLSRANLRHRTGSVDNLLADGGAAQRTVTDKYGSVFNVSGDSGAENGPGGGILKNGQ